MEVAQAKTPSTTSGTIVTLNVGGQVFCTTMSTLTSASPESYFSIMFSGNFAPQKDMNGNVFIDRDGSVFIHVLNYLRDKKLVVPRDEEIRARLLIEANFYNLPGLVQYIRDWESGDVGKDITGDEVEIDETLPVDQMKGAFIQFDTSDYVLEAWKAFIFDSATGLAHKISSITSKSYKYQLDEDLIYLISKDNQDSKRGSSILRSGTTLYSGDHAYSLHVATSIPMGTPYQTEQLDCAVFTNIMVDRNSSSKHIYCLFKVLAASRWMKAPFSYGSKYNMPCVTFSFKAKKVFRQVDHMAFLLKDSTAVVGDGMLSCTLWGLSSSRLLLEIIFSNRPFPLYTLYKLPYKK